ncbi:replication protein RepA [Salmonella enterica]|nr:replication protein RepA [Salmonella enterica]
MFCPAKNRKIIGVFVFLVPGKHLHQNQFPATLQRGQPSKFFRRSAT